jgi:two-component system, OmpR family, response regulator
MSIAPKIREIAAELIRLADALQEINTVETIGKATFCRSTHVAQIGQKKYRLTRAQARIITALLDNRGTILPREDLLAILFGRQSNNYTSRTIDTHIHTLRQLFGDAISTVHGRGYLIK